MQKPGHTHAVPPSGPGLICPPILGLFWSPYAPGEKHPHASKRDRFEQRRRLRMIAGSVVLAAILVCIAMAAGGAFSTDGRGGGAAGHAPHRGFVYRAHVQGGHEHHEHGSMRDEHIHGGGVGYGGGAASTNSGGFFARARSYLSRAPAVDSHGNALLEPAWSGPDDSLFFDMPPEGAEPYACPCCGWQGHSFGTYNGRADAGCPVCGVSERHRFACYLFQTELQDTIKAATATEPQRFLHFNPTEQIVRRLDRVPNFDQILADYRGGFPGLAHIELENFQLPSTFLDGIMLVHVLEHAEDDKKAMEEISRVLKPDAWMIIEVPCHSDLEETVECLGEMSSEERAGACGHANHFRRYSCSAFRQQLADAGFDCHLPRMTQDDLARLTSHIIPKQFVCWRAISELDEEGAEGEVAEKYDGQQNIEEHEE